MRKFCFLFAVVGEWKQMNYIALCIFHFKTNLNIFLGITDKTNESL